MKKIEEIMCDAVENCKSRKIGNTEVKMYGDTCVVYLHGNAIWQQNGWQRKRNHCEFSLAGWNTATTRSRLRALGVDVTTKNFIPMYKGNQISETKWYSV